MLNWEFWKAASRRYIKKYHFPESQTNYSLTKFIKNISSYDATEKN